MQEAERLSAIEERNARVESDKAWEVSLTRRAFIMLITYLTVAIFLWLIDVPHALINALVPAAGYLLSTLSLPWLKMWWLKKVYPRDRAR